MQEMKTYNCNHYHTIACLLVWQDSPWCSLQLFSGGEELFGLPVTEYPELLLIKKELNLLQKLYGLYNDVIDTVNGYYDILWVDVDIEKINQELQDFQNRWVSTFCLSLVVGIKISSYRIWLINILKTYGCFSIDVIL